METATKILGRDLGSVVGKTTQQTPDAVVIEQFEIKTDKNIVLYVDIFYIGGLTFQLSVSRRLKMFMVSYLSKRTVKVLKSAISNQVSTYKSRSYVINYILVDNESGMWQYLALLVETISGRGYWFDQPQSNRRRIYDK